MPPRPIAPETLQLIHAVHAALQDVQAVEEKTMFGIHVFMVNDKICLGVQGDELLVRLPPADHQQIAEMPGVRPLTQRGMAGFFFISPMAYATRPAWQHWIASALAFNPLAKASPKRQRKTATQPADAHTLDEERPA